MSRMLAFKAAANFARAASEAPPQEGQAVHAAQFRYRLPDERGVEFTAVLPWVHLLPDHRP